MRHWLIVSMLVLLACSGSRTVTVRATVPGLDSAETPVENLEVVALPYDRDSVIAALEAAGPPRPEAAYTALDSLFARFREPFVEYARLSLEAAELRRALGDTTAASGGSAALHDSLAGVETRREAARAALDRVRQETAGPIDSLRAVVERWKDSTYRQYDSLTTALSRRREPRADTTDARGHARLELGPGDWWLYARSWDVSDPNRWWYWNVPVEGDTVRLTSRNARRLPRY